MKTSLLILCAFFAIAASTPTFYSTLEKWTWVAPGDTRSITIIKCVEEVKLQFVIIDKAVLIEPSSSCTIDSTALRSDVNADRKNGSPAPIFKELTCTGFAVIVPESQNKISETIIECIPA